MKQQSILSLHTSFSNSLDNSYISDMPESREEKKSYLLDMSEESEQTAAPGKTNWRWSSTESNPTSKTEENARQTNLPSSKVTANIAPAPRKPGQKILIGASCYNSEKTLAKTLAQLQASISKEIVVFDNGSTDNTKEIARSMGCEIISNSKHSEEQDVAIRALFFAALERNAEVLLTVGDQGLDASYVKEDLPKLVQSVLRKECDIAVGSSAPVEAAATPQKKSHLQYTETMQLDYLGQPIKHTASIIRAYSHNAMSKINPTSSATPIPYAKILELATSQGLKITQLERSAPLIQEIPEVVVPKKVAPIQPIAVKQGIIFRIFKSLSFSHPMVFFGIPALALLAIAAFAGVLVLQEYLVSPLAVSPNRILISAGALFAGFGLGATAEILLRFKSHSLQSFSSLKVD